jgi:hypothetical protein
LSHPPMPKLSNSIFDIRKSYESCFNSRCDRHFLSPDGQCRDGAE